LALPGHHGLVPTTPASLDHTTLVASDFVNSLDFFDASLAALGLVRAAEYLDEEEAGAVLEAAGWGPPGGRPLVWVVAGPTPTRGAHLCLRASSAGDVERFYRDAVAAGGIGRNPPRRWPIYRRGEFNAVVADPDGNLIEAVSTERAVSTQ
jgi:catechol 2,3-dioxygenase-like lactoylglutathione lyase family enzyme